MKDSISTGWIVAFFVVGILLGLLGLKLMGGGDPLRELIAEVQQDTDTAPEAKAPTGHDKSQHSGGAKQVAKVVAPESPPATESATAPALEVPPPPPLVVEPLQCDRERAGKVREKARQFAEVIHEEGRLTVRLRGEWDYYSDSVRRSFVAKFADSDTCLNGQSRPIDFYYQGKLYAHVDPETGIEFK